MEIAGSIAVVTGGASGLGQATAKRLIAKGARVALIDLPSSDGDAIAASFGANARFISADVTSEEQLSGAFNAATGWGPVRATVHCAGRGGALRILDKAGNPGSLAHFASIVETNLVGSFNVLRLAAGVISKLDLVDGERGVIVLTASVAAFEGQIGQIPYASSKAGIVGMTIVAARDLASRAIRVCTIAPGLFDTPLLNRLPDDVKRSLANSVPHPARLGHPFHMHFSPRRSSRTQC